MKGEFRQHTLRDRGRLIEILTTGSRTTQVVLYLFLGTSISYNIDKNSALYVEEFSASRMTDENF